MRSLDDRVLAARGARLGVSSLRSLPQRIEMFLTRLLFGLPGQVQVRLSGKPQICVDGQMLAPEMQLLLAARSWRGGQPLRAETPHKARAQMRREALRYTTSFPVGQVRDLTISGAAGPLRARHYAPDEPGGPHPLLVYFHGGGFVAGDLDTHDAPCRLLCRHGGVHVLAVDYRLAPEHPFPAAVDDARAALRWAQEHACELSADPSRVGVGGDSAGGNLSAVVSLLAAHDGGPAPILQLLIYPPADRVTERASQQLFDDGFMLTGADIRWYDQNYVGQTREHCRDPRVSPLFAPDLSGLCPALVVTAGFDPLRDEGEAYAAALEAAGTRAVLRRLDGLVHGFVNMVSVSPAAYNAVLEIARSVRSLSRSSAPVLAHLG